LNLLLLLLARVAPVEAKPPPVVLVPGLASTQLDVRVRQGFNRSGACRSRFWQNETEWHRMWIDASYFVPGQTACILDRMTFSWNSSTGELTDKPSLESRTKGWGNTTTIDYLDPDLHPRYVKGKGSVFGFLIEHLVDTYGYQPGVDLRGAPYDWRRAPSSQIIQDMLKRLKSLVEETYKAQGAKVMLVSHSMGGNMVMSFLRMMTQDWKDEFLVGWVSIGTVFGGSTKIVVTQAAGENMGIVTIPKANMVYPERTWESMWWMFPHPRVFDSHTIVASSPSRNYTLAEMRELFAKLNYSDGYDFFTGRVKPLEDDLSPFGVPLHCFYSTGIDTLAHMNYNNDDLKGYPKVTATKVGDGAVNEASLEVCRRMEPASVHFYRGIEHLEMIQRSDTIKDISEVIVNSSSTSRSVFRRDNAELVV